MDTMRTFRRSPLRHGFFLADFSEKAARETSACDATACHEVPKGGVHWMRSRRLYTRCSIRLVLGEVEWRAGWYNRRAEGNKNKNSGVT